MKSSEIVRGSLDFVSWQSVEGWAVDPTTDDKKAIVYVEIDGVVVWSGKAEISRSDLIEAEIGDGAHAFYAQLPPDVATSGPAVASVRVFIANTGDELPGSPVELRRPELMLETTSKNSASSTVDKQRSYDRPSFLGSLDEVNEVYVRGWAYNPSQPDVPVAVDIFKDDRFIRRVDADEFRADLLNHGIGTGCCAFVLPTPSVLLDGKLHSVSVKPSNTNVELNGSPKKVLLAGSVPLQTLSQIRNDLHTSLQSLKDFDRSIGLELIKNLQSKTQLVSSYQQWHAKFGIITSEDRSRMISEILTFESLPTISIIMPTYNTPTQMLEEAIESVTTQIYPHWQLCIADDASNQATKDLLKQIASKDERITLIIRMKNGHISEASNSALAMARGDYICLLDHDDVLTDDALFQVVKEINKNKPSIIYSDEDKIDNRGVLSDPHFKPDFNYSLLLSYNYICHLFVVAKAVVKKVGKFRTAYNGSQDYDFILRCVEVVNEKKISHIPLVLYHWRAHEGSTSTAIGTKSYALDAGRKAIADHLKRKNHLAEVEAVHGFAYRVKWSPPEHKPLVSVIIPTRDCAKYLSLCISGLLTQTNYKNIEIIILNNRSEKEETFDLFAELEKVPRIKIVNCDFDFNYAKLCNLGVLAAAGELLLMLNNDIEILYADWLDEMVAQVLRPAVGAVGAKLYYPDGRIQHAGVVLGIGGVAGHAHKFLEPNEFGYMNRPNLVQEMSACTAACLLIRRQVFEAIGGFDQENLPVAFNDVDLCLKIRGAGHKIIYTPFAVLRHHESLSRGAEDTPAKFLRSQKEVAFMAERWSTQLLSDPSYSPNLTLQAEDFSIDQARGTQRIV